MYAGLTIRDASISDNRNGTFLERFSLIIPPKPCSLWSSVQMIFCKDVIKALELECMSIPEYCARYAVRLSD